MDQRYRSWDLLGAAGTPAKHLDLAATGVQAILPVTMPMVVTNFLMTISNDVGATGAVKLIYHPTAGSVTGAVDVATITLTTAHLQGKMVGKSAIYHEGDPGGEYIVEVTDAGAAGDLALASIWGFERYEQPGNLTDYVETA